jgi:S-adenosyl-L-methionine hydrolase (adenosine-forming)
LEAVDRSLVTFVSDYGSDDEFVGVCHAVIERIAPEARVLDLSHGIPRHDVRQGAAVLANALGYASPGVHLAIVDPGVGSTRKAVVVRTVDEGRLLVGPDNGLLGQAIDRFGGAAEAIDVSLSPARLQPVSATFHGRDVFAPVAAHLARGELPAELGEPIEVGELAALERTPAVIEPGRRVEASVGYVDRFGNAALDLGGAELVDSGLKLGHRVWIEAGAVTLDAVYLVTFADVKPGELLLYLDSYGNLALAINRASAAERLGVSTGDRIVLRPA